jgi:hypothetical protein
MTDIGKLLDDEDPLFCYAIGPVDHWFGAVNFIQALMSWSTSVRDDLSAHEAMSYYANTLLHLEKRAFKAFKRLGWEGDISEGPYYFALPPTSETCEMLLGIIIKQRNNGACFVASPQPLPHLKDDPS